MVKSKPSRRIRTAGIWWPDCDNYENPSSLAGPQFHKGRSGTGPRESLCEEIRNATEEYLESIAYPLIDDWCVPVYSFRRDGEITPCFENTRRIWANITDARWVSGDYLRQVQEILLKRDGRNKYHVIFNNTYSDHQIRIDSQSLVLDDSIIGLSDWDDLVLEWASIVEVERERASGRRRRELAHLKATLPAVISGRHGKTPFPIFSTFDENVLRVWIYITLPLSEWSFPDEVIAVDDGPYVNDGGLISPASLARDDVSAIAYGIEIEPTSTHKLTFRLESESREYVLNTEGVAVVDDEQLKLLYPPFKC